MNNGDILVKRGFGSKSTCLWKVVNTLVTSVSCIEVVALTKNGKEITPLIGVYWKALFDYATPEEIMSGRKLYDHRSTE